MQRDAFTAKVTITVYDGEYDFALKIGQLLELQEKTGVGPYVLLQRLVNGDWRVKDAYEIIRLGRIGAGTAPLDALDFVRTAVEQRPLMENIAPALSILSAALIGPENTSGKEEAPFETAMGMTSSMPSASTDQES